MDEALLLLQAYQTWIYLVLAVAFLLYARSAFGWFRAERLAEFGLERERARRGWTRSGAMAIAVVGVGTLTFLVTTIRALPCRPPCGQPRCRRCRSLRHL
jgi:hypothetical protein